MFRDMWIGVVNKKNRETKKIIFSETDHSLRYCLCKNSYKNLTNTSRCADFCLINEGPQNINKYLLSKKMFRDKKNC
jgi:hypothetical protein